jgi:hypothetical protein
MTRVLIDDTFIAKEQQAIAADLARHAVLFTPVGHAFDDDSAALEEEALTPEEMSVTAFRIRGVVASCQRLLSQIEGAAGRLEGLALLRAKLDANAVPDEPAAEEGGAS